MCLQLWAYGDHFPTISLVSHMGSCQTDSLCQCRRVELDREQTIELFKPNLTLSGVTKDKKKKNTWHMQKWWSPQNVNDCGHALRKVLHSFIHKMEITRFLFGYILYYQDILIKYILQRTYNTEYEKKNRSSLPLNTHNWYLVMWLGIETERHLS